MISSKQLLSECQYQVSVEQIADFKKQHYVLLKNAINPETLSILSNYYWMLMRRRDSFVKDPHAYLSRYGDLVNESLLLWLKPSFERLTNLKLLPSYSYMRIYNKGNFLGKHTDRVGCEFAATISIDYDPDVSWPFFVQSNGKDIECILDRGDIIFYRGHDVVHWREQFEGKSCTQLFLFYVDANGPYQEYKFDKRETLGSPQIADK